MWSGIAVHNRKFQLVENKLHFWGNKTSMTKALAMPQSLVGFYIWTVMKRKTEMRTCPSQELTFFLSTFPGRKPQFFNGEFSEEHRFAFPGQSITQWLTELGCAGRAHRVALTENKMTWCHSQLRVIRHPHKITKQLLPWFWISEDTAKCWREKPVLWDCLPQA